MPVLQSFIVRASPDASAVRHGESQRRRSHGIAWHLAIMASMSVMSFLKNQMPKNQMPMPVAALPSSN